VCVLESIGKGKSENRGEGRREEQEHGEKQNKREQCEKALTKEVVGKSDRRTQRE
jgi:hypothetical protein